MSYPPFLVSEPSLPHPNKKSCGLIVGGVLESEPQINSFVYCCFVEIYEVFHNVVITTLSHPYVYVASAHRYSQRSKTFLSVDASCQKMVVTLHQKQELKPKTNATMGVNYSIDCRHCGEHTDYYVATNIYRRLTSAELNRNIDTECAIRCPNCRSRLNSSEAEFLSQVTMSLS